MPLQDLGESVVSQKAGGMINSYDQDIVSLQAVNDPIITLNQLAIDFPIVLRNKTARLRPLNQLLDALEDALDESPRRNRGVTVDIRSRFVKIVDGDGVPDYLSHWASRCLACSWFTPWPAANRFSACSIFSITMI